MGIERIEWLILASSSTVVHLLKGLVHEVVQLITAIVIAATFTWASRDTSFSRRIPCVSWVGTASSISSCSSILATSSSIIGGRIIVGVTCFATLSWACKIKISYSSIATLGIWMSTLSVTPLTTIINATFWCITTRSIFKAFSISFYRAANIVRFTSQGPSLITIWWSKWTAMRSTRVIILSTVEGSNRLVWT